MHCRIESVGDRNHGRSSTPTQTRKGAIDENKNYNRKNIREKSPIISITILLGTMTWDPFQNVRLDVQLKCMKIKMILNLKSLFRFVLKLEYSSGCTQSFATIFLLTGISTSTPISSKSFFFSIFRPF